MLQLQFTTQAETRLYASKLGIGKFGMICRYANLMPGGNFPPSNTHQGQLPNYNCITKRHKHLPGPNHRISGILSGTSRRFRILLGVRGGLCAWRHGQLRPGRGV